VALGTPVGTMIDISMTILNNSDPDQRLCTKEHMLSTSLQIETTLLHTTYVLFFYSFLTI